MTKSATAAPDLKQTIFVGFRIPKEEIQKVNARCQQYGLKRSDWIRQAIRASLGMDSTLPAVE